MPVPQTLTGKMPVPPTLTGKMPVPQIKQARCLFHKLNRQDACSTNTHRFLVGSRGWAGRPPIKS
ncbi:hypothetical protein QUB12_30225 [Microcoleus sp. B7-D4]